MPLELNERSNKPNESSSDSFSYSTFNAEMNELTDDQFFMAMMTNQLPAPDEANETTDFDNEHQTVAAATQNEEELLADLIRFIDSVETIPSSHEPVTAETQITQSDYQEQNLSSSIFILEDTDETSHFNRRREEEAGKQNKTSDTIPHSVDSTLSSYEPFVAETQITQSDYREQNLSSPIVISKGIEEVSHLTEIEKKQLHMLKKICANYNPVNARKKNSKPTIATKNNERKVENDRNKRKQEIDLNQLKRRTKLHPDPEREGNLVSRETLSQRKNSRKLVIDDATGEIIKKGALKARLQRRKKVARESQNQIPEATSQPVEINQNGDVVLTTTTSGLNSMFTYYISNCQTNQSDPTVAEGLQPAETYNGLLSSNELFLDMSTIDLPFEISTTEIHTEKVSSDNVKIASPNKTNWSPTFNFSNKADSPNQIESDENNAKLRM